MIINHNVSSHFALRQAGIAEMAADRRLERLATGIRVHRTADDPSQLDFESQIRGLNRASRNASDGISFIQTSEGFLQGIQDIVHRLRELSVQAATGIYTAEDRMYIQVEVSQLVDEVDRIASHAQFNGMNFLTGRFARPTGDNVVTASMWLHIGANMDERIQVFIGTMTAASLAIRDAGSQSTLNLATQASANMAIGTLDAALERVSSQRSVLGAYQNRLEHLIRGIDTGAENFQAADSRIRDANMAGEMIFFTRDELLGQAAQAMLAQANIRPSVVLQLLQ
ncbi:MAG: flagellin [Spirochaetes bacterium]|nr:flagellin [Spirochaetota bacterium]